MNPAEIQGVALHQLETKLSELTGYVVNAAADIPEAVTARVVESV